MNTINANDFNLVKKYLPTFARFITTHQISVVERGSGEYVIQATGKPQGLDTTRTYGSENDAWEKVSAVALGYQLSAAA